MHPKVTSQFWKKKPNLFYCAMESPESAALFLSTLIKLVNMNIKEQLFLKGCPFFNPQFEAKKTRL